MSIEKKEKNHPIDENMWRFLGFLTTADPFMPMVDAVVTAEVQVFQLYALSRHRGIRNARVYLTQHLTTKTCRLVHLDKIIKVITK